MSLKDSIICVDLDGTLIEGDLSRQAMHHFFKLPWKKKFFLLLRLRKGYASFKVALSHEVPLNRAGILYNEKLLAWLKKKKKEGCLLVLASASSHIYVEKIFQHMEIFDHFHGSTETRHLIGEKKGKYLAKIYGYKKFTYCGNSWIDLLVWRYANHAIAVNTSRYLKIMIKWQNKTFEHFN